MIRGIIFDLDGTLLDTYSGLLEALNLTLAEFGKDGVDLASVKRMVGRGLENLLEQAFGPNYPVDAVTTFKRHYQTTFIRGTVVLPQVVSTLIQLRKLGILMAVGSNKPAGYTDQLLMHFDLDKFFSVVIGPDRGVAPKPDPQMLLTILTDLKIHPQDALYVGDMPLDVESARAAGTRVAVVPTGGAERLELHASGADFLLDEFAGLIKIVKKSGNL